MTKIFNPGDRVVYRKGTEDEDKGTVIRMGTDDDPYELDSVYARWDVSGVEQYARIENVELIEETLLAEEEAVMLLLSLGYTITKK